ncbi:hypothetical protein CIHG_09518 [Coccidioides immitis H538.4]|uniref:Uncharacterized protein n=3 Tax=Coccidioides TaxID=5500 RepID=A0A0J8S4I8_COCIT|nr:hypothetical protein CPAG_04350 [Coccidioides posadasii RMSCC 3488]KMP04141.1 hypothetical protein CIRG_03832 [Coccidioides immitis RMSCC 2394]KMU91711.1 hypothetical protein CIHG_09518 [Coccidioides immitis H538.4]
MGIVDGFGTQAEDWNIVEKERFQRTNGHQLQELDAFRQLQQSWKPQQKRRRSSSLDPLNGVMRVLRLSMPMKRNVDGQVYMECDCKCINSHIATGNKYFESHDKSNDPYGTSR